MSAKPTHKTKGQSIIEMVVGVIFLIPIVLFLFDVAVLVLSNTANDNLAKSACRAAASATKAGATTGDSGSAFTAATTIADNFSKSSIINPKGGSFLTGFSYNATGAVETGGGAAVPDPQPNTGQVACVTTMVVTLPVPFPFIDSNIPFQAKDVEPIVSISPP